VPRSPSISSNSRWQTSLNQSDPMPATLNINQIISSPRVVSKTDSLSSPASVKASGGVFTLLYKTLPSIEYHLPVYLTLQLHIKSPTYLQTKASQAKKTLLHPTHHSQQRNSRLLHLREKKRREKEKRKKWNTTAPSTEALPVGASTCVLVGPEPIVEVMDFPIRLLRNFLIL